jgi:hypothetical protein
VSILCSSLLPPPELARLLSFLRFLLAARRPR